MLSFDPDRTVLAPPAFAKPRSHLLHLFLPHFPPGVKCEGIASLLRIPRSHPDDRPLFRPDPSHSLLAMCVDYELARNGRRMWLQTRLVILVFLSTIRTYLAHKENVLRRAHVLPWDMWAPTGARIVSTEYVKPLQYSLTLNGSRCVVTIFMNPPVVVNPNLVDAHPWAVDSAGVHIVTALGPYRSWKSRGDKTVNVEGMFPCRMEWQSERMREGDEWACTCRGQMTCIACVQEECTMLDLRVAELSAEGMRCNVCYGCHSSCCY
ncbi:hypothetical protein OH76DRAFT_278707 [Lentinus brumalis]|uniref:Uncharacterized protein n=1 Tax=Lentinus brumalis TaxID=2498619 RepID=A0A371CL14_9APHY|nr:hypothetical protein OH76DRAFT_278707 [Polyporus brumalis]